MDYTSAFYVPAVQLLVQVIGGIVRSFLDQQYYFKLIGLLLTVGIKARKKDWSSLKTNLSYTDVTQL